MILVATSYGFKEGQLWMFRKYFLPDKYIIISRLHIVFYCDRQSVPLRYISLQLRTPLRSNAHCTSFRTRWLGPVTMASPLRFARLRALIHRQMTDAQGTLRDLHRKIKPYRKPPGATLKAGFTITRENLAAEIGGTRFARRTPPRRGLVHVQKNFIPRRGASESS